MTANEQGEYLTAVHEALATGNEVMATAQTAEQDGVISLEKLNQATPAICPQLNAVWDKFSLGAVADDIANQTAVTAANMAAYPEGIRLALDNGVDGIVEGAELSAADIGSTVDRNVKSVAAAALNIKVKEGKIPLLDKNTPTEDVTSIACCGVESVKAMTQFGAGNISGTEAVERVGRAVATTVGNIAGKVAKAAGEVLLQTKLKIITKIPVIGSFVSQAVGTCVEKAANFAAKKFIETAVDKIKPIAGYNHILKSPLV